jgi:pimeloyl-ACP methyl ester carboxylesterase
MTAKIIQDEVTNGTLVLFLHAYASNPKRLASLLSVARGQWPNAKFICPELPLSRWSIADPNQIVADLLATVDSAVQTAIDGGEPIQNIVLVGHSFGALLARKLYVVACGETKLATFEDLLTEKGHKLPDGRLAHRMWASKVSRIILFAGMNRGWRISHHLSLTKAPLWALGAAVGHLVRLISGRTLAISTIRKGAEFITQLRIQWIRMRQQHKSLGSCSPGGAVAIQLLGSRDDMVAPEDNIDLVSGGDFIYLDVPYSGHADVVVFDDPIYGANRAHVFLQAVSTKLADLKQIAIIPSDIRFTEPDESVTRVAFVIHGIRDAGYWTHKIARRIKQRQAGQLTNWATETSSYGYFPMLPFMFPWYRREKVEWLMDQYTEALAKYPNATFSYVGHSNGTYLLAKALELYPCCSVDNVVFAGSVVRSAYAWEHLLDSKPPRVSAVLNFVATGDYVVAFFPKFFELFGLQDLGSAGHDGFSIAKTHPKVYEITYVKGGHGAAIEEPLWDSIADFVGTGVLAPTQADRVHHSQTLWIKTIGRFPPLVWAFIAAGAWFAWTCIVHYIAPIFSSAESRQFATGFGLATYLLLLWLVITRL